MDSEQDDVRKARQAVAGGWSYEPTTSAGRYEKYHAEMSRKAWGSYFGNYKASTNNGGTVIGGTLLVIALLATFFFLDLSPDVMRYFAIGFKVLAGLAAGVVCFSIGRILRFNSQFRLLLSVLVTAVAVLLLL
ncbi:hypothetical protein [Chitinophaga cymbidii]|uniref:Uncharacterized protein n=1 Tax=Chitinophaga cymbidii TaxID=1096750 RepID=A0A512RRC8_9BACT|nr:hypothetical protein [Chitinophaga cymbidii]GEP98242.1 hypothetical protein CCY01nite_45020 [Chitinophaga cymbidii]